MTKVRKVKRRKTYKVSINRKRLRNKMRKLPQITCPEIQQAWENKKSTKSNLLLMGLSYDPNKSLKIPRFKTNLVKNGKQIVSDGFIKSNDDKKESKKAFKKGQVALALEEDAKAPRESGFRLPNNQVQFLTYLMDKYGDDYEAMARDKKNYWQLTWRKIKSKINAFKKVPEQYAEYLVQKGEIVLDDPETLTETKKKIAAEKAKIHCTSTKVKKTKKNIMQWAEEMVEDEEPDKFETMKTLDDESNDDNDDNKKSESSTSEKKLHLFSDDESDDEPKKQKVNKNVGNLKNGKGKLDKVKEVNSNEEDMEEDDEDDDNDDGSIEFKSLSDMSDEDLSDDDMLDDEFGTESD